MEAANDNAEGKVCTKCGEWKPLGEFYTRLAKDGSRKPVAACIPCTRASANAYARRNSATAVERVRQWRLLPGNVDRRNELERERRRDPEVIAKRTEYNKEYRARPEVRERRNAQKRERRKNDPEYRAKQLASQKEYYSRPEVIVAAKEKRRATYSTEEWREKFNARRRERYATDPEFFCAVQCRGFVVRTARKAKTKKAESTATSLGYTPHQLRLRLECQFKAGMSWDNHGEWHIDHKKPIAAFLAQGITDPRLINALCNLQPMWRAENQAKSSAWPLVAANDNAPLRKSA